jgi:hypothetical protein
MKNLFILGLLLSVALTLDVPSCDSPQQITLPFTYIDGTPDDTTTASLCHDNEYLQVHWSSVDS